MGRAVGIAVHLSIEDIDFPVGQMTAKMVESSSMPEAELENDAGPAVDLPECPIQAGMLRFKAKKQFLQSRYARHCCPEVIEDPDRGRQRRVASARKDDSMLKT